MDEHAEAQSAMISWSDLKPSDLKPSDLDLRREALGHAVSALAGLGRAAVLEAAKEFYAFLKGS